MDFCGTQTYRNLARSFAGESQAGMRYQLVAKQAKAMEYQVLSDAIKGIAKNETYHAKAFYEELIRRAKEPVKIKLDADYPYWFGTLEENLAYAAEGEHEEHVKIYADFASVAQEEGFESIAALYRRIAEVEKHHEIVFSYLCEAYKGGTLYRADHPMLWICSECGYMHTAEEAWKVCPVCKAKQGYVGLHLPFNKEDL